MVQDAEAEIAVDSVLALSMPKPRRTQFADDCCETEFAREQVSGRMADLRLLRRYLAGKNMCGKK